MEYTCYGVSKTFNRLGAKRKQMGINNANLVLNTGDIVGVVGLSSSGKTTLIDVLSSKVKPDEGKLNYDGKKISRVYDEFTIKLNKNLTVFDNMIFFGKKEKMNELEVENRMAQLRDIFSLNKYINTKASDLDELNRIKSELAMILLTTPRILFIDDAFSFLNNSNKNEILKCLKRLNKQERTIIVISASRIVDVEKIINRLVIVSNGEIIYDKPLDQFKAKYDTKKMFEVYLNKNINIVPFEGVEIKESGDYYFKLLFENKEMMFAKVISLFDVNNIVDLKVGSEDLIDIVEKIKKDDEYVKN